MAALAMDFQQSAPRRRYSNQPRWKEPPARSGSSDLPREFSRVPTSKNAVHLFKSLSRNSSTRSGGLDLHSSYRSDWTREDPAALPLPPPGGAPSLNLHPPQQQSPPLNAVSSPASPPPSEQPTILSLGPHAVPPHSWAKIAARTQYADHSPHGDSFGQPAYCTPMVPRPALDTPPKHERRFGHRNAPPTMACPRLGHYWPHQPRQRMALFPPRQSRTFRKFFPAQQ